MTYKTFLVKCTKEGRLPGHKDVSKIFFGSMTHLTLGHNPLSFCNCDSSEGLSFLQLYSNLWNLNQGSVKYRCYVKHLVLYRYIQT